jgi:hypothetical protein
MKFSGIQRSLPTILLLLVLASFTTTLALGQNASFTGHVTDSSGAAVVRAQIVVRNQETGDRVSTATTGAGDYTVPYLQPGRYTLTAAAPGFKTLSKTDIDLQAAQVGVIDFELPVGSVSQSITVNSNGSLLDRGDATRGEEVENTRVTELPLNGRNPVMLDRLNSSVIWDGNLIWQRPFDGQVWTNLDINGSGNYNTEIMLDGQPDQTPRPQNGGHTNGGYVAPDDAVQDFKIVTNPYDAEYGQTRSGAIDLDLKSGTNQIHGDVYEYLRRTWLDADWWVNDAEKVLNPTKAYLYGTPQHKLDQYGTELDGPVVIPKIFNGHDRLFFVAQVENWNEVEPSFDTTSVPCTASTCGDWADGDFSGLTYNGQPVTLYNPYSTYPCTVTNSKGQSESETCRTPFSNNQIPTSMINPVAQALLKYYPAPNQPGNQGTPWQNNFYAQEPTIDRYRNALIKLDWAPTEKDKFTLRYGYWERYETDISNGILSGPAGYGEDPLGDRAHTFGTQWVHTVSPTLLFDFMADVDVKAEIAGVAPLGFNLNSLWPSSLVSQLNGLSMMPGFQLSGFTCLSGPCTNGPTGNGLTTTDALNLFPSVTWVKGKHTFHAGIDWRIGQYATVQNPGTGIVLGFNQQWTQSCWFCGAGNNFQGAETDEGNTVASMLLGLGSSGSDSIGPTSFYSNKYYAPYVQDDWKVTPNLTFNLGVRYDLQPYYVERHNRADYAFNTTTPNPVDATLPFTTLATGAPVHDVGGPTFLGVDGNPRKVYSTDLSEIQPRIGFAYSISSDLVVRGGFGEVFQQSDAFPNQNGFSSSTSYVNSPNGGLTPANYNPATSCCFGGNLNDPFPSITQPTGSSLGPLTGIGNGGSFLNPNFQIPNVWNFSLGFEQQLTRNDTLELSYVGNRAPNNESSQNIDHWNGNDEALCNVQMGGRHEVCDDTYAQDPTAVMGYVPNPYYHVTAFSGTTPYGQVTRQALNWTQALGGAFGGVTENNVNGARSWYNSLQVTYQHRWSNELTIHGTWTWSKLMDAGGWSDNNYLIPLRTIDSLDRTQNATISMVWDLPVGRGRTFFSGMNRVTDAVLGGWELASMPIFQSGAPYQAIGGWDYVHSAKIKPFWTANGNLQWYAPCYWTTNAETGAITESQEAINFGCSQPDFIQIPTYGANPDGNHYYSDIREAWNILDDSNLSKNFQVWERMSMQFRLETFNTFNHPLFSGGAYNGINQYAGQIGATTGGGQSNKPRYTQLAVKLLW